MASRTSGCQAHRRQAFAEITFLGKPGLKNPQSKDCCRFGVSTAQRAAHPQQVAARVAGVFHLEAGQAQLQALVVAEVS